MSSLELANKLTSELEAKLKIKFDFKYFRTFRFIKQTGWYEPCTGVLHLPNVRGVQFREFLYHELGHVLFSTYEISEEFLKIFCNKDPAWLEQLYDPFLTDCIEHLEHPHEFVSDYATRSTEEDFCETFSAWVMNDFKTNGLITYDGNHLNLKQDKRLQKKFFTISAIAKQSIKFHKL